MLQTFVNEQIKKGAEAIGDHPKGLSLYNEKKRLHFVMIPKNASTSISIAALTSNKDSWTISTAPSLEKVRYIVILRDPADRFISATNMFLTTGKMLVNNLPLIVNNNLHTVDCHYQPQHMFIDSIPINDIDFFWYNKNVAEEIEQFYNLNFNHSNLDLNLGNKLVKEIDISIIKTLYAEDYKLINSVKFINI